MKPTIKRSVKFHAFVQRIETQIHAPRNVKQTEGDESGSEVDEPSALNVPLDDAHPLVSLVREISEQTELMNQARSRNFGELQELAIELAVVIASHIVKVKLEADELGLDNLVHHAIEQLLPSERITIRVNPIDRTALNGVVADHFSEAGQSLDLVEDPNLPRGSCFVVGDDQGLLGTLESRLENIRDTLLQGIEYARIERRKAIDFGGALRRFPDRRKPA